MGTRTIIPGSNNAGQIGSDSNYWNKGYFNILHVNNLYTSTTGLTTNTITLTSGTIIFEGTGVDDFETFILATNPTADRIISFPDATGTVSLTEPAITGIASDGANRILTSDGDNTATAESTLAYTANLLQVGATDDTQSSIIRAAGSSVGAILYIQAGHPASGATDVSGGALQLSGGGRTGDASGGSVILRTTAAGGSTGTTLVSSSDNTATLDSTGLFTLSGDLQITGDTGDYFKVSSTTHGATTISTLDASATGADLTMDIDGNIILSTPDEHYSTSIDRRKFSVTSSTDHDHNGDVVYFGGGSTTKGDICYLKTDGEWASAQANAENTSTQLLAIALGVDPDTDGMLLRGMITLDHNVGNNQGVTLYLSDGAAGQATPTVPASNNDVVRVVGYNMGDDDQIWFCPDNTWVVVSA